MHCMQVLRRHKISIVLFLLYDGAAGVGERDGSVGNLCPVPGSQCRHQPGALLQAGIPGQEQECRAEIRPHLHTGRQQFPGPGRPLPRVIYFESVLFAVYLFCGAEATLKVWLRIQLQF